MLISRKLIATLLKLLYDIVAKMREGKNQFLETYAKRLRGEEWPGLMIEWLQQLRELYTKIDIINDEVVIDVAAGAGSQCMRWILGGESLYG